MQRIAPGVFRIRIGVPEALTPSSFRQSEPRYDALDALPPVRDVGVDTDAIRYRTSARGIVVVIPIADVAHTEQFFGLGLQLSSINHTARKRTLRVNSDPVGDGDSHAPVPFVVSTAGYGIYVDTARYATFYLGSCAKTTPGAAASTSTSADAHECSPAATDTESLYAAREGNGRILVIEVPAAQGVDIYIFGGPTLLQAVQRYNLFSGGGCLPPLWGLGVWYRVYGQATMGQVMALASSLREAKLPCDVLGLEPGWQTHAYSCSFAWNPQNFPDPDSLMARMQELGFHLNLWEHIFVHPSSPLYQVLKPHAGDYQVWSGIVPDLGVPEARREFAEYHRRHFVEKGVTGFKLDECDNSDFILQTSWSFPEASAFPSGLDGEQMHSLLGVLYQQTVHEVFEQCNTRTYSSVRSSGALAAALPFVLYSDLYDHRMFIRGVVSCGFSGLLWSPEVRHATSHEDFLRRIQSVVLSPQALINAWYCKNPPWLQYDRKKNNADELLDDASALQAEVRELFRLRMSLIPYLYAAFARYCFEGVPPFRALAMDHPADAQTHTIDDEYLMGDDLLVAPIFAGQSSRSVYLPEGEWYDLHSHKRYSGGAHHTFAVDLNTMLVFVRSGTIVPLAAPVEHVAPETIFAVTAHAFGPEHQLRPTTLFEDDGVTFDYRQGAFNHVTIHPDRSVSRTGNFQRHRYQIVGWRSYP